MKRCMALPAASLLRCVLTGDVESTTCALCLCDDSLLPSAQVLTLGSEQNITISDLADEVHIDVVSGDLYSKMVCSACVDKMISFYLFTKQCLNSANTLENLLEVAEREVTNTSEQFFDIHSKEPQQSYAGSSLKINVHLDIFLDQTVQLQCSKCDLDFPTLKKLSLHQKEHIRSPYYLCRICDQKFTGYHIFLSHWACEHTKLPPPIILLQQCKSKTGVKYFGRVKPAESKVCNVCDTLFMNCSDFDEHQCVRKDEEVEIKTKLNSGKTKRQPKLKMVTVSKEEMKNSKVIEKANQIVKTNVGLFACGKCSLNFPSIKELSLHLKVHGQGPYNRCTICDKMFNAYSGLLTHYRTEHPDEQPPVQMKHKRNERVGCNLCGDMYSSRRSLQLHIFTKHSESHNHEFCNVCNKIYPNNVTHRCRKRRSNKGSMKKSPQNTDVVADDPLEGSDDSQPAKRKKRTVQGKIKKEMNQNIEELRNDAGVFECRKCYSDFDTIEELSAHQREHGKSPYHQCRVCDKTFNGFASLLSHYTSVHPERPPPTPVMPQTLSQFNNDRLSCDHCAATFKSPTYLRYHMFRRHGQTATEQVCSICHESYFRKHSCRFTCTECPKYPCVHKKYLQAYMNAEEDEPRCRHRCIECDYMYRNRDDLLDHVNRCHLMIFPQTCKDCGKKWPSKKALRKHMSISHPVSKSTCEHCRVPVPKYQLQEHIDECKLLDKPFCCDLCDGRFASEHLANTHKKSHQKTDVVCDVCCFQCGSVEELKRHMLRCRTPFKVVKTMVYPCSKCTLDFPSLEESIAHELSHPVDAGYLCRICESVFETKAERYECTRTHRESVTEPCTICGRLFNKFGLKSHMKMHVNKGEIDPLEPELTTEPGPIKMHMCDVCGSMHATAYDLKKHSDRHSAKKKCPYCPRLVQKRHLANHLMMHECGTKQARKKLYCKLCNFTTLYRHVFEGHINKVHRRFKPYVCDVCDKKFYSLMCLRSHQNTHVARCLECNECNMKFRSTRGFDLHMMQHRGELPHACEHCDLKFVSASRKKEHQDRVHFGPQHPCALCDKSFYRSSSLKSHVSVVHEGCRKRKKISITKIRKILLRQKSSSD